MKRNINSDIRVDGSREMRRQEIEKYQKKCKY